MLKPQKSQLFCRACRRTLPREAFDPKFHADGKPDGMHMRCRDCRSGSPRFQSRQCDECHAVFQPRSGFAKRCDNCRTVSVICTVCGVRFQVPPHVAPARAFCSRSCHGQVAVVKLNERRPHPKPNAGSFKPGQQTGPDNPRYVEPLERVCIHCGTTFFRKPHETRGKRAAIYCSARCRGDHRRVALSGENSPFWVGGPSTYRGRSWLQKRRIVVARQDGKCAECGKHVGPSLPVHHIRPFREFPTETEANEPSNLLGLCQSCHMKTEPRRRC